MSLYQAYLSSNGGEVTPYLAYLTNFDKHASSCERMENFLPLPFGGARKRPGTLHLATLPAPGRCESFTFSDGRSSIIVFTETAFLVFTDDILEATVEAPFSDPFLLQFSVVNDIITVVDPLNQERWITTDGADWTISDVPYSYPPLLDENDNEAHTFNVVSGADPSAAPGSPVDITSSDPFFETGHIGAYFAIAKKREANDFERSIPATTGTTSPWIEVSGQWFFNSFGNWSGTWTVERSDDGGTTIYDERVYTGAGDVNKASEGEVEQQCLLRLKYTGTTSATARGVLSVNSAFVSGLVRITAVTSSTVATGNAIKRTPTGVTSYWTEGAFSTKQGFPMAVAIHDRSLCFAGTQSQPMGFWKSKTDNLTDFTQGTDADSGMFRTLAGNRQSPIRWLVSQRKLFAGTDNGEWVIGQDTSEALLSPTNFIARQYTRFGSNRVPAMAINDSVFFVERQGRRLRELAYLIERETFDAADLTRLAEHIPVDGIRQMAWQHNREPFLWCVTGGDLLAFAYNRQENIAAWSRHTTVDGLFRSVTAQRNDSDDDDVYFIVERASDFHLEKLATSQQAFQEARNLAQIHHVDGGVHSATTGPNHEVSMPPNLEGKPVYSLADGIFRTHTVTGGKIRLPVAATHVHAGLPITSTLTPLPLDIQTETGASHGRMKQGEQLTLNIYNSFGGSYAYDGQIHQIDYTVTGDPLDAAPTMRTGWIPKTLPGAHVTDLTFSIIHTEPYPFLLRAAVLKWSLHES